MRDATVPRPDGGRDSTSVTAAAVAAFDKAAEVAADALGGRSNLAAVHSLRHPQPVLGCVWCSPVCGPIGGLS